MPMGYDTKTTERVRQILSERRDIVEKKMIGGLAFMVNGQMCCGVTRTGLMVRVGREAYTRTLAQPHVRPMEFAGRPLSGFVSIDPAGYRTDTALAKWVQRGIDFASTLPEKKSATRKPRPATPEKYFEKIVKALRDEPGVTPPSEATGSKSFGSSALRIHNQIFAMISSKDQFVVKLPRERVDALVASGVGERFDPGHGRLMKEWLALKAGSERKWLPLAREAMEFVGSKRK